MSTKRLDTLRAIEGSVQQLWKARDAYTVEVKSSLQKENTFFVTFPYPYMNGRLHLGHAFSLSKVEYTARYQKLIGQHVLWPFGFHGTGMPIAASADRIRNELADACTPSTTAIRTESTPEIQDKTKSRKSKIVAKTGNAKTQVDILLSLGIPQEDIPQFVDPVHWLKYFTPIGQRDLELFGLGVDWRRSFVTTSANFYYDAFIQWQFRKLLARNRLKFGLRPSIYSTAENQICADHDRASGEGVNPVEVKALKLKTVDSAIKQRFHLNDNHDLFLISTFTSKIDEKNQNEMLNVCFVSEEEEYFLYRAFDRKFTADEITEDRQLVKSVALLGTITERDAIRDVYIMTRVAAQNMVYQGILPCNQETLEPYQLGKLSGSELVGLIVEHPAFVNGNAKVLAHPSLCCENGTGILSQRKKSDGKQTFDFLDLGSSCSFVYHEPEKRVVSRSGCNCIVALCNQWYSDYGNQEWKQLVLNHVSNPDAFDAWGQRTAYERTINWLEGWACSRSYGLGTCLPWEADKGNKILIESLSDSTIYFAYYTIAHMLQGDLFGTIPGTLGIQKEQVNDAMFDFVFCQIDHIPEDALVEAEKLQTMRSSFEFWYPMNLRCSGKDLLPNHLTMSLFHHAAIWPDRPDLWPRAFYINGHLMLDSAKMAKSTGNFLTLAGAIEQYGADGARIALADAGDSVDDANFERQTALSGLMRLYVLLQFVEEILTDGDTKLREGESTKNEVDRMFEATTDVLVERALEAYAKMAIRDALKYGFFELLSLKDTYKLMLGPDEALHRESILAWIKKTALVMSPITPHISEHIWTNLLQEKNLIVHTTISRVERAEDNENYLKFKYLQSFLDNARKAIEKGKKQNKSSGSRKLVVRVAREYPKIEQEILTVLQKAVDKDTMTIKDVKGVLQELKSNPTIEQAISKDKKALGVLMGFASFKIKSLSDEGIRCLDLQLVFDECGLLKNNVEHIKRSLGIADCEVKEDNTSSLPGAPTIQFSE